MLAPIFMIKAVVDGMIERQFGRIVNITSASVKSPIPELGMSNGARAGLTGFVAGLAGQIAKHNGIIKNILPGPFLTDRLRRGVPGGGPGFRKRRPHPTGQSTNWCRSGRKTPTPVASAIPPSSATRAPFCAPRRSASSSATTSFSTAATSTRRSPDGLDVLPARRLAKVVRGSAVHGAILPAILLCAAPALAQKSANTLRITWRDVVT